MKKMEWAALLALVAAIVLAAGQAEFSRTCAQVRQQTVRLHVVGNSDSEADQTVKLAVRDGVLSLCEVLTAGCPDEDAAAAVLSLHTDAIARRAGAVLKEQGFSYGAGARVCESWFNQRSYGGVTLPAGEYTALRVELGEAAGRNWWCMVYPGVCFASAQEEETLSCYTEEARTVVLGGQRYALCFKVEEWLQSLKEGAR